MAPMEAPGICRPAPARCRYRGPATWAELHPIVPDEFVCGYLKGRGVADVVAENVAREASKAFRNSPNWHRSAAGRTELVLRLYWTLLDAGHTSESSSLTGDLMKELLNRRVIGADRAAG